MKKDTKEYTVTIPKTPKNPSFKVIPARQTIDECLVAIDNAIVELTMASRRVSGIIGFRHDAWTTLEEANEKARIARAKLEIVRKRLP